MKEEVQTFKGHKKEATGIIEWILCVMMLDNLFKHFLTFSAFSVFQNKFIIFILTIQFEIETQQWKLSKTNLICNKQALYLYSLN
jgi:hypothetical protein